MEWEVNNSVQKRGKIMGGRRKKVDDNKTSDN